jgi:hypothetical protein
MTTDLYSRVYFNDGEGLDYNDLNNIQSSLRAKFGDQFLQYLMGAVAISGTKDPSFAGQNGTDAPNRFAYCLQPGQAYLRSHASTANIIQVAPGTLYQKVGSSDGSESTMLGFTFVGTESWSLTAGDATNPRVDLLQMKLEYITDTSTSRDFEDATTHNVTSTTFNKKKRVQCTLSVKAGTPNASPTVPEPDTGYVAVGSVMVGNTYATGTFPVFGIDTAAAGVAVVHDQRMPLGKIKAYRVDPKNFKLISNWVLANSDCTANSTNPGNELRVPFPGQPSGRIIAVGIHHDVTGIGTVKLGNCPGFVSGTFNARSQVLQATSGGDDIVLYYDFEAHHTPNVGPTITQSAASKIGVPVWGNGQRCPREKIRLETPGAVNSDQLVLQFINTNSVGPCQIGFVTFFVAEGI